jgi:hypothetical protein
VLTSGIEAKVYADRGAYRDPALQIDDPEKWRAQKSLSPAKPNRNNPRALTGINAALIIEDRMTSTLTTWIPP